MCYTKINVFLAVAQSNTQSQKKGHNFNVHRKYFPLPYDLSYYGPDSKLSAPHRDCLSTHRGQLLKVLQQLNHFDTCTCGEERKEVGGKMT